MRVYVSVLPAAARGHPACGASGRLTGRLQVSPMLLSLLHFLVVPDHLPAVRKAHGLIPHTKRRNSPKPRGMTCVAATCLDTVGMRSVCGEEEETTFNHLLQCDGCRSLVHMACYGVAAPPEGRLWLCDLCKLGALLHPPNDNTLRSIKTHTCIGVVATLGV